MSLKNSFVETTVEMLGKQSTTDSEFYLGYSEIQCHVGCAWYDVFSDTMTWSKPVIQGIPPLPRSLHSATVIGTRLVHFLIVRFFFDTV